MTYVKEKRFVQDNYDMFPVKTLYKTNSNKNLIIDNNDSFYIYAIHKVKNPEIEDLEVSLQFFQVFKCLDLEYTNPVGYIFVPTLPKGYIIRYTPVAVVATGSNVSSETFDSSTRESVYKDDHIEILHLSCGCEVITDLSLKLGVWLGE